MPRCLLLQRRGRPPIPAMAVLHHRLQPRRRCRHTSPGITDWKLPFYKVFGQKYVCVSQPVQLLIRGFREQRFVARPALCIRGAALARWRQSPLPAARPTARSSFNLQQDPCCSDKSRAEGFPQAGFIELCYRKIWLRQPHCSQNNLSFLILSVTSLGV